MNLKGVFSKSMLRSPWFSITMFFFLTLLSFATITKAAEHIITDREIVRLEKYYRSIGVLTKVSQSNSTDLELLELLESDPNVYLVDSHYTSSGIMEDHYNSDIAGQTSDTVSEVGLQNNRGVHNTDVFFVGTLMHEAPVVGNSSTEKGIRVGHEFIYLVHEVLAGYPEYIQTDRQYMFYISAVRTPDFDEIFASLSKMDIGKQYLIRGRLDFVVRQAFSHTEAVANRDAFYFAPLDGKKTWWVEIPLSENKRIEAEYPSISEEIELLNNNIRSLFLFGTNDLSALPWVQEDERLMFLAEGRWINEQDQNNNNPVIVLNENFARLRNLSIGDGLKLTQRGLRNYYYGYITGEESQKDWRSYPVKEVIYEIVGLYTLVGLDNIDAHNAGETFAFVPNAMIPQAQRNNPGSDGSEPFIDEISFILEDPRNQTQFNQVNAAKFQSLGYDLRFVSNNLNSFYSTTDQIRKGNLNSLFLYSITTVIMVGLSNYLYYQQQKKNFSIARILGSPLKETTREFARPLMLLGLISILVGGTIAWFSAIDKAKATLSVLPLPSGINPSFELSPLVFLLIALFLLSVQLFFLTVNIRTVNSKRSLLASIHDHRRGLKPDLVQGQPHSLNRRQELAADLYQASSLSSEGKTLSGPYFRYLVKRISRSPARLLFSITIILSVGVLIVLLSSLITRNLRDVDRLISNARIQADLYLENPEVIPRTNRPAVVSNTISRTLVNEINATGWFDFIAISTNTIIEKGGPVNQPMPKDFIHRLIIWSNDLSLSRENWLRGAVISYYPGFNDELFSNDRLPDTLAGNTVPIVVPRDILNNDGLTLGDVVYWIDEDRNEAIYQIVGVYDQGQVKISFGDNQDLDIKLGPIAAPISAISIVTTKPRNYDHARFYLDPTQNHNLEEIKQNLESLIEQTSRNQYRYRMKFWDEEFFAALLPLEENINLFRLLLPILTLACIGIIFLVNYIMVIQNIRETALLRILGVEIKTVHCLHIFERLAANLIGLIIALVIISVLPQQIKSTAGRSLPGFYLLILISSILGSIMGSLHNTKKRPIEFIH